MIEKILCKILGHTNCPENISLECGYSIINIHFICRRCGRVYIKLYPAQWNQKMDKVSKEDLKEWLKHDGERK